MIMVLEIVFLILILICGLLSQICLCMIFIMLYWMIFLRYLLRIKIFWLDQWLSGRFAKLLRAWPRERVWLNLIFIIGMGREAFVYRVVNYFLKLLPSHTPRIELTLFWFPKWALLALWSITDLFLSVMLAIRSLPRSFLFTLNPLFIMSLGLS